jgi:hypothetical protein
MGKEVRMVFLDFTKAFDKVWHKAGADPEVLLTDALNLALVGGSGGIPPCGGVLPWEILKSRTSEMRFPAF